MSTLNFGEFDTYVVDARGHRTDYTYNPDHGGVLTGTGPAVGGVRPQKRLSYEQRHAWIKNGAGGYSPAATPVWVLTQESFCRTSAATGDPASPCATAGDEVRTTYDYGPNGGPNNLFVRDQAVRADGQTLRTTFMLMWGTILSTSEIPLANMNARLRAHVKRPLKGFPK